MASINTALRSCYFHTLTLIVNLLMCLETNVIYSTALWQLFFPVFSLPFPSTLSCEAGALPLLTHQWVCASQGKTFPLLLRQFAGNYKKNTSAHNQETHIRRSCDGRISVLPDTLQ